MTWRCASFFRRLDSYSQIVGSTANLVSAFMSIGDADSGVPHILVQVTDSNRRLRSGWWGHCRLRCSQQRQKTAAAIGDRGRDSDSVQSPRQGALEFIVSD